MARSSGEYVEGSWMKYKFSETNEQQSSTDKSMQSAINRGESQAFFIIIKAGLEDGWSSGFLTWLVSNGDGDDWLIQVGCVQLGWDSWKALDDAGGCTMLLWSRGARR